MKKKNTISALLGLLILAVVIAFVLFLYWKSQYIPSGPLKIDYGDYVSEMADNIYRSETQRFGIQIPAGWTVEESGKRVSISPPSIVNGRAFLIEVTQLSSEEYKAAREATGEAVRVFDEQRDVAGFEHAEKFKISTELGTDETVLFITLPEKKVILNYHEFNEAHQQILQSFQFLD